MLHANESSKSSTEQAPSGAASTTQKEEKVEETKEQIVREGSTDPGNPNYYEKDGLRTYGDGQDHDHTPPVSLAEFR
jgi:hypothetical protein